jgi:hypothetical protein
VPARTCSVSFVGPTGVRHGVDLTAESLYEAAIIGVSMLREDGWAEQIAPGTQIEIQVRQPATTHCVSVAQLPVWVEAITPSPDEMTRKR